MSRPERGFTLIELMIVIAIIAVIASIAIPNLKEAQRNSNEAAAVTVCRQYLNAQGVYHRTDYDQDGSKEYATIVAQLYDFDGPAGPAEAIRLIDISIAHAEYSQGYDGVQRPRTGYRFADHTGDWNGDYEEDADGDGYVSGFGLTAFPDKYFRTGMKTFIINSEGTVYETVIEGLDFQNQDDLITEWPEPIPGAPWKPVE